jgi:hypothetical protein
MPLTIKLKNVEKEFLAKNQELTQFVNTAMRARAFQALGDLKSVTPVDTGRARNSWTLTTAPYDFKNALEESNAGLSLELLKPPSQIREEKLYITNGVDYIDKLNAGSSKQAPARFIESTITKYFEIEGLVYLTV